MGYYGFYNYTSIPIIYVISLIRKKIDTDTLKREQTKKLVVIF